MNNIMDGRKLSENILLKIKKETQFLKNKPGLGILMVGNDPASVLYTKKKEEACEFLGFYSEKITLPESSNETDIINEIRKMDLDPKLHGILVQLPLPNHVDFKKILLYITPEKDVDGLNPLNIGKLSYGDESGLLPCTPKGIIRLLDEYSIEIKGRHVVIINHSNLLGRPLAMMLLNRDATVAICHKMTENLSKYTKDADILITATGVSNLVKADMVKPGAVVIDAGICKNGQHVTGDVDFEKTRDLVRLITPVPGGVGPMTVAMLMENTMISYKKIVSD